MSDTILGTKKTHNGSGTPTPSRVPTIVRRYIKKCTVLTMKMAREIICG